VEFTDLQYYGRLVTNTKLDALTGV